jgi:hypothetical protein
MAVHFGRELKQLDAEKNNDDHTQSAASAIKSIITKFGSISDNTKYHL